MYEAIVDRIEEPCEDIKTITLKIPYSGLSFKAGQWVDFYIPKLPVVGYSMTSPPHKLESQNVLNLAVKYSEDPPTKWIHRECEVGATVSVKVGGEFFYDPESDFNNVSHDILLIGGGIGINPLLSIAQHYVYQLKSGKFNTNEHPNKMIVLYSARTLKELIFKELFKSLVETVPSLSCQFFATRDPTCSEHHTDTLGRRLTCEDVQSALSKLRKEKVVAYVCGPSSMIDELIGLLSNLGLSNDQIRFEKWW